MALIPIWRPDSDEHLSVCHKGFHAINVMAVCNAHLSCTNFVCIWHGSVHDSTIFNASYLQACMEGGGGGNGWLLGDCGYAIKPYRYQKAHTKMKNTSARPVEDKISLLDYSGGQCKAANFCLASKTQ